MTTRTLVNFQKLPKRDKRLDRQQADTDIRQACGEAERRLVQMAQQHTVTGWRIAEDGWQFSVLDHTVVGMLKLERPE